MADYISGGMYFSGIGNGTDFSEIVDKLKKVESIPMNRMKLWKSDWNKRYEAFGKIIDTVREAKTKLAELNNPQKFLAKMASSSNENILTATAGSNAIDGSHSIEVKQLASNAIWASTKTFEKKSTSINTTGTAQNFTYTYKGREHSVSIPKGTTLESFANMVNQDRNNPGVKVSVLQTSTGYTFQVQGTESGARASLSIAPTPLFGGNSSASSTWLANAATADPAASLASGGTAIKAYTYDIYLQGESTPRTVTINGNVTQQDLVNSINSATGMTTASFSGGKMVFDGIDKVEITPAGGTTETLTATSTTKVALGNSPLTTTLDPFGDSNETYTYSLTMRDGTTKTIALTGDKTRNDLIAAIRAEGATVTTTGNTTTGYTMTVGGVQDFEDTNSTAFINQGTEWKTSKTGSATATIQTGVVPHNLTYNFTRADGTTASIPFTSDQSMQDLVDTINKDPLDGGLGAGTATWLTRDGKQYLQLQNVFSAKGVGLDGQVTSSSEWAIQQSRDALFTVDNWPQEMTSASNNVTNVLEGVSLTLKDVGRSQISVAADKESVRENIQTVLDIINSVVKKVQELTKWDSQKATASNNPEDSNYSPSQWDQEKGSVLTGNYGVQLFNTRIKSLMSGSPPGFTNIRGNDVFSGDMVAALAQMGIKTNTEQGDPTYGLFVIAPISNNPEMQELDQKRFDDAINNNLEAVINFFAADDVGTTTSSDFRYYQHIKGITKPGTYKVSYDVNADGTVNKVFINGVEANPSDTEAGAYTVANAGGASGLSIYIDNFAPGTHTGEVSIKQGKVREMEDFFTRELVYYAPNPKEPSIGEKNGALMILQTNYKQIMDNIDKKIEREQTRLTTWERTQRLAFSRLETLLGQYERNQQSMSSQLTQLTSNSG